MEILVAIEGDNVVLEGKVALAFPENFAGEAKLLKEKLTGLYGLEVVGNASVKIVLEELLDRKEAVNDEYYTINIDDNLIKISAATPHGIFNGCLLYTSEHETYFATTYTDITGRYVCFRTDMTPQLQHESLNETHNLSIRLAARREVRTAFTATHGQSCQ